MKRALIIGGGFAGCCAADHLAEDGWQVTLVESAPVLGAGNRTMWYGKHPHTLGPRHFLSQSQRAFDYLNSIVPLRDCGEHRFLTYVERDDAFYGFPIHEDDVPLMPDRALIEAELGTRSDPTLAQNFEEFWIASVGKTLYSKFVESYSRRMWRIADNKSIDSWGWSPKGVTIKSGPRAAWDTAMSAYPYAANGYDDFFELSTGDATVHLSTRITSIDLDKKRVWLSNSRGEPEVLPPFDLIVSTASPDDLMGAQFGALRYIGRDFHRMVLPVEWSFPKDTAFLYYANDEAFTRAVEFKFFTRHVSQTTLIGIEMPSSNGRHYPCPWKSEMRKAAKYHDAMPPGIYSIGRSGSYRYGIDINGCLLQVFDMMDEIKGGGQTHPVPGAQWRSI